MSIKEENVFEKIKNFQNEEFLIKFLLRFIKFLLKIY